MSTIDQAFVKAFARRQTADVNTSEDEVEIPASAKSIAESSSPDRVIGSGKTVRDDSLKVDRSVADTADVWIDPVEDRLLKTERPHEQSMPRPRFIDRVGPPQRPESPDKNANPAIDAAAGVTGHALTDETMAPRFAEAKSLSFPSDYAIASFTTDLYAPAQEVQRNLQHELDRPDVPDTIFRVTKIKTNTQRVAPKETSVADSPTTTDTESPAAESVTESATEATDQPATHEPVVAEVPQAAADTGVASATAKSTEPVVEPASSFNPAWEIDASDVPNTVSELFFEDELFESVGDHLAGAVDGGLRSVMVTSHKAGEGRSTVAMGIALAAAAAGVKVLLIDGDLNAPTLASELRLDLDQGWDDALTDGVATDEVAVYAGEDDVTFLPLLEKEDDEAGRVATPSQDLDKLVDDMKSHFDLIIIDGGIQGFGLAPKTRTIDSAFIVRNAESTSADEINAFAKRLMQIGIRGVGVIENFVQG